MAVIPLDSIESIAKLEPLAKSEHWYTGVALVMMEMSTRLHTETAIAYFEKALEIAPGGWVAMEGLARCHADYFHDYYTAIYWMEKAVEWLPQSESFWGLDFSLKTNIFGWKLQLGISRESVNIAQAAYEYSHRLPYGLTVRCDQSIMFCIKHYIEALYRTEQYARIVEVLYELDARSLWTQFLRLQYYRAYRISFFEKIGNTTRVLQDPRLQSFMSMSLKKAVQLDANSIAEDSCVWLAFQAAQWLYHYASRPEDSIGLWEKIVTLLNGSHENIRWSQLDNWQTAVDILSTLYLGIAKSSLDAGEDPLAHIAKLKSLSENYAKSKTYHYIFSPTLALGK